MDPYILHGGYMFNFKERLTGETTGHLTIHKKYKGQPEELFFDDHNIIVSGMSTGLSMFFTGSGSQSITDYQIDRFQVGCSGPPGKWFAASPGGDVSTIYQLSGPVDNEAAYNGTGSNLFMSTNRQLRGTGVADLATAVFALIPFSKVTRIDDTSVRYTIVLDEAACSDVESEDTANTVANHDVNLSEIGLFMKNPNGNVARGHSSLLVAYRSFTPIRKTEDFALIFRWTINF
jgi:hypothetical protein